MHRNKVISGCVSLDMGQVYSSDIISLRKSCIPLLWNFRMCTIASYSSWHIGKLEYLRCFLYTITKPVAVSQLTHLLSRILRFNDASFLVSAITSQLTSEFKTSTHSAILLYFFQLFTNYQWCTINYAFSKMIYSWWWFNIFCEPIHLQCI